jgi:hypothetical protein
MKNKHHKLADQHDPIEVVAIDPDDLLTEEELAEKCRCAEEERQNKLNALAMALNKKRQAAVDARTASGIETIWKQDEEFYEGVDDANRDELVQVKPRDFGGYGNATIVDIPRQSNGSTVFMPITRTYVDFSAGRAEDMLIPTDDRNWDIRPTPMPDIISAMGSQEALPVQISDPNAPSTVGQAARQMVEEAQAKVEKARTRIEDWLNECQYQAEVRKVIKDAAKVGVGVLKGPTPVKVVSKAILRDPETGTVTMEIEQKTVPESKRISYWNLFPDPASGDCIHNGNYIWERDFITARQLRDLKGTLTADGQPMYLDDAIDECLREGPQGSNANETDYCAPDNATYRIWYYHGIVSSDDLACAGIVVDEREVVPCVITMVNDRVIKAALSTLDSGSFPYDTFVWQPRENHWAGIGVARQVRSSQRIINGAWRNMMDNAGMAGGPMMIYAAGSVKPHGGGNDYSLRPGKLWKLDGETEISDVNKAIAFLNVDMRTNELMMIVQAALKAAEDATGMPLLMQGQQGHASQTVGGMTILNNNSNTPMRAIAKQFDDQITTPHLNRYYEWLLLYGEDDDEKGEFIIDARGSSALFERDAQNQAILQLAQFVKDPDFRINPEAWFKEFLRAQRLDPTKFTYSDIEWQQKVEQMQQQEAPADPKVQAAQINAEASIKRAELTAQATLEKAQIDAQLTEKRITVDTDRDAVYVQSQMARDQAMHQAKMAELQLKRELAMLEYAHQQKITLEQVKAKLAETTMKLEVQKELSQVPGSAPQVLNPPSEPAGRAPDGQAYQR